MAEENGGETYILTLSTIAGPPQNAPIKGHILPYTPLFCGGEEEKSDC